MGRPISSEDFRPIDEIPEGAPEHVRRAIADYNRAVSQDIRPILVADQSSREERRRQAQVALEQQQRLRIEAQDALARTRQELAHTMRGSETPDDEFAAKRRAMAEKKRLLLQQMATLQTEIKEIEDDTSRSSTH